MPTRLRVDSAAALSQALLRAARYYNAPWFVTKDPVSIPRRFLGTDPVNVEVAGLLAAHLAWGRRETILSKAGDWLNRMENRPADFLRNLSPRHAAAMKGFVHRTLCDTDALWMMGVWSDYIRQYGSLQGMFEGPTVADGLARYASLMRDALPLGDRLRKHFASPLQGSACKRMVMFLRWMIRKDDAGVDLGCWSLWTPDQLLLPLDVHAARTARSLGLLSEGNGVGWKEVVLLAEAARRIHPQDPALLDFALFGLGEEATRTGRSPKEVLQRLSPSREGPEKVPFGQ